MTAPDDEGAEDRCVHDMVRASCALCAERASRGKKQTGFRRGAGAAAEGAYAQPPRQPLRAQFVSTCRECGDSIWPGEIIAQSIDGNYVHEECA